MEKRYVSTKELSHYIGVSESAIRAWVRTGRLPFSKIGRLVKFDLHKIEDWLRKKQISV